MFAGLAHRFKLLKAFDYDQKIFYTQFNFLFNIHPYVARHPILQDIATYFLYNNIKSWLRVKILSE